MIIGFLLSLFGKAEISGNGVLQYGGFWPWNEYDSFSWRGKSNESFELKLKWKQRFFFWRSTRLLVPLEDHKSVRQLLEPNWPEQPVAMDT